MKKNIMASILALGVGIILANQVSAGMVGDRRKIQRLRIREGVITGELTRHEAKFLNKEQRRIRRQQKKVWADGNMTRSEWRRLQRLQNRASNRIYRLKHNSSFRHRAYYNHHHLKHDRNSRYRAPYYSHRLKHSMKSHHPGIYH